MSSRSGRNIVGKDGQRSVLPLYKKERGQTLQKAGKNTDEATTENNVFHSLCFHVRLKFWLEVDVLFEYRIEYVRKNWPHIDSSS